TAWERTAHSCATSTRSIVRPATEGSKVPKTCFADNSRQIAPAAGGGTPSQTQSVTRSFSADHRCCDSRLRCDWQCGRDARAQRRFQRCGKKWLNLSRISPNTRSLQPVFEQKVRRLASRLKQQKET